MKYQVYFFLYFIHQVFYVFEIINEFRVLCDEIKFEAN